METFALLTNIAFLSLINKKISWTRKDMLSKILIIISFSCCWLSFAQAEKIQCYSGTPLSLGGISTDLSKKECDEGITQCKTWYTTAVENIKNYGCGLVEKQTANCTKDALGLTTTCYCDGALCNVHNSASASISTNVALALAAIFTFKLFSV